MLAKAEVLNCKMNIHTQKEKKTEFILKHARQRKVGLHLE